MYKIIIVDVFSGFEWVGYKDNIKELREFMQDMEEHFPTYAITSIEVKHKEEEE